MFKKEVDPLAVRSGWTGRMCGSVRGERDGGKWGFAATDRQCDGWELGTDRAEKDLVLLGQACWSWGLEMIGLRLS